MKRSVPFLLSLLLFLPGAAWSQTAPVEGLRDNPSGVHALVGVTVVTSPGNVTEDATIVIRNGVIESVGTGVTPPPDARLWDLAGRTVYPGFIDPYSDIGMGNARTDDARRGPSNWNPQNQAFLNAVDEYSHDEDRAEELRSQGFTAAMAVPQLGIFRGRTGIVSLGPGPNNQRILGHGPAQSVSFSRSGALGGSYPNSAMGGIAFLRQSLLDADWYERAHAVYAANTSLTRPETNRALAALQAAAKGDQPLLFEVRSDDEYFRMLALAEEFPIDYWIRGNGSEYRILEVVQQLNAPIIIPIDFPNRPGLQTVESSLSTSLTAMRRWHVEPENPARLAAAGVEFAFTADGLNNTGNFLPNLRRAVERGLDPNTALSALTTVPARFMGVEATHGSIETGKVANLVVSDGDLFRDGSTLLDVWVDGRRYEIERPSDLDVRGEWVVTGPSALGGQLNLGGTAARPSGSLTVGGNEVRLGSIAVRPEARRVRITLPGEGLGMSGTVRLSATLSGEELHGWGELPDGTTVNWQGERVAGVATDGERNGNSGSGNAAQRANRADPPSFLEVRPDLDFGRESIPEQPEHVLVRNATVWTMGPQGRLENADLLVTRGRVAEVGQNLTAPSGAEVIDATGKHVSPGMIDAHIHAGGSGTNESGSAIVPEVRMGDVITMSNSWMYRHLAGGLTVAHMMHGSANPIGGQNVHMKMRWGAFPEDQKLEGAPRTVKFALGENPKRRDGRYPDTRMGTEQIIRDHFKAAREYEAEWQEWERNGAGIPPRRDLRLEAIVDILNGDILVQSHSYRQDEILMLMRLAEEFDFRVKAFHHGVEAYKVAPELRDHGAGAVVWSDWSSFKIEAYDASLYNARLLNEAGVVTSLHSDNSQIAARMNWEAGKMVRAGVEEEDALAMVTINTATLLGIEDQVGSLEEGKDADFVIWSGNPLSQFSIAEQTWVDGRRYFDLEEDRELRQRVVRERADFMQYILNGSGS